MSYGGRDHVNSRQEVLHMLQHGLRIGNCISGVVDIPDTFNQSQVTAAIGINSLEEVGGRACTIDSWYVRPLDLGAFGSSVVIVLGSTRGLMPLLAAMFTQK
jgi:hypothetical protein